MKCLKEYKRHGSHYETGKNYSITPEKAEADEAYLGKKLWESESASAQTGEKKPAKKKKGK